MICKGDNDTPVAPHIRRGGRALVAMLDLGNAGERLFVSGPPVVFPALGVRAANKARQNQPYR